MNLPNTLTIARIFIVPLLVAVLVQERIILHWNGAVITNDVVALDYFLGGCRDRFAGRLSRPPLGAGDHHRNSARSDSGQAAGFGRADFAGAGARRPGWLVVLLVGREFAVSGLRSIAAVEGYTIKASELGKTKTFWQVSGDFAADDQHGTTLCLANGRISRFTSWCCFPSGRRFRTSINSGARSISAPSRVAARNCLLPNGRKGACCWHRRREALRNRRRAAKAGRERAGDLSTGTADLPPSA